MWKTVRNGRNPVRQGGRWKNSGMPWAVPLQGSQVPAGSPRASSCICILLVVVVVLYSRGCSLAGTSPAPCCCRCHSPVASDAPPLALSSPLCDHVTPTTNHRPPSDTKDPPGLGGAKDGISRRRSLTDTGRLFKLRTQAEGQTVPHCQWHRSVTTS